MGWFNGGRCKNGRFRLASPARRQRSTAKGEKKYGIAQRRWSDGDSRHHFSLGGKGSLLLMRIRYAVVLLAAATLPILSAQNPRKPDADWPMYNRDLAGTRYSPLTQINTKNVAKLTEAWSFRLGSPGPAGGLRGDAPEGDDAAAAGGVENAAGARGAPLLSALSTGSSLRRRSPRVRAASRSAR